MRCLNVEIVDFVDESFPGFVRCAFLDADGARHTFIEKVPVLTTEMLWKDSVYPQNGTVPCDSVEDLQDGTGRRLARISMSVSDSMNSSCYETSYIVLASQLTE